MDSKAEERKFNAKSPDHKKSKQVKSKVTWITREMAEELGTEYILLTTLKETIYFLLFMIIATTINYAFLDQSMHHLHKIVNQQIFTVNNVQSMNTASDFWIFIHKVFTKSFYFDYWYYPGFGVKMTNKYDRNILYENNLLGVPRLRQVKVRNDSCVIHSAFKNSFISCYGTFNSDNEDISPFGLGTGTAWTYSTQSDLGSISYWGKINWYHGGGFYMDLSREKSETLSILNILQTNLWISRGTRAIFLDFPAYNINNNIFCIVRAAFEFPSTGGVISSSRLYIARLLRYNSIYDHFILTLEIIYLCFTLYYTIEEFRELSYFKWKYFKLFWTYVDVFIITLSYASLGVSCVKNLVVEKQIASLAQNDNHYANLELAAVLEMYFTNLMAIQLFFIYLKIFKYLNFNKSLAQLSNTLSRCSKDVTTFAIMFFVIFAAFAIFGNLLFGIEVPAFSTFFSSIFTLLKTILGDFDYSEIEKANRVLAPVFFLTFIFLVFFVLLNMFLAIINDTYADVKTELAIASEELRMTGFLKRGYYNALLKAGLNRFVKRPELKKNEYQITVNEIKSTLKKLGFSDIEIEMFFSRYNIEPNAENENYDRKTLVDALEGKIDPSPPKLEKIKSMDDDKPVVAIEDFPKQQERLNEIEELLINTNTALRVLSAKLDRIEKDKEVSFV